MRNFNLRSWSEFEEALRKLEGARHTAKSGRVLQDALFRGVGNRKWRLETTLERSHPSECCAPTSSFLKYYRKVLACKPAIETFSGKRWDKIPTYPEFETLVRTNPYGWLDMFMMAQPEIWEYLVYLRHHSFPSPLLDWTASPYVAAFFALDSPPKEAKRVSVYAFLQDTSHGGSSDAHLFVVGPYMQSDPRHFLQQCRYTMCVAIDSPNSDYLFRPHQSGLGDAVGPEGRLLTITIPIGERLNALKHLEQMNINSFSLFGSEDSLVHTVGRRGLLFRD